MKTPATTTRPETVTSNEPTESLAISHDHGLVVLHSAGDELRDLKSWGRHFSYFRSDRKESIILPEFHSQKYRKRHDKAIRQNTRFLNALFNQEATHLSAQGSDAKITVSLSPTARKLVCSDVRTEVYNPIAIESKKGLVGGMNAYIWNCHSSEAPPPQDRPLVHSPITSVVTGMCMFGSNVKGIDQHGNSHPLTNTFYQQPEGAVIEDVQLETQALHPYEQMMLQDFDQQLLLYKALALTGAPVVHYQNVLEEYLIYGLDKYLRGGMTKSALLTYGGHVYDRTHYIKQSIGNCCTQHNISWDHGASSLSALFADTGDSTAMINSFLEAIDGFDPADRAETAPTQVYPRLISQCLQVLAKQPGAAGEVWSYTLNMLENSQATQQKHGNTSLLFLNYLHYAAKVAITQLESDGGRVCLAHPFHEKAMALAYKNLFAERFGPLLCVNWVPSLFSHTAFKQGLYYLEQGKDRLNQLIAKGLCQSCNLQVAAEACEDHEFHGVLSNHIESIITETDTRKVA